MTKRERRTFTPEFKKQMVQLYQNGKTKRAIIDEYDLTLSSLDRWIHCFEVAHWPHYEGTRACFFVMRPHSSNHRKLHVMSQLRRMN